MRILLLILSALLFWKAAEARDLRHIARHWKNLHAEGNRCKDANLQVLANGDSVSVLFDDFGVKLDDQTRDLKDQDICRFSLDVEPPDGSYLAAMTQIFSGGVIKSKHSTAEFGIAYRLGGLIKTGRPIKFGPGKEIGPADAGSVFNESYTDTFQAKCREGRSQNYVVQLAVRGERKKLEDMVIAGLDTVDTTFESQLALTPTFKACPPERPNHGGGNGNGHGNGGGRGNGPGPRPR